MGCCSKEPLVDEGPEVSHYKNHSSDRRTNIKIYGDSNDIDLRNSQVHIVSQ
jgi:hypothetical protein